MKNTKEQVRSLLKSFSFAFSGIKSAVISERNFRIHITICIGLVLFSLLYRPNRLEAMVLVFSCCFVMVCELFNTAIETLMDMNSNGYNRYVKLIKDISAGAVLISAIGALVCGLLLFWKEKTLAVFETIIQSPLYICIGVLYVVFGTCFVFLIRPTMKKKPDILN